MLCFENRRKQLSNCLNTICFYEASITGIICSRVECWHLDEPPTGWLAFLQGDWWRSASSFGFSCPLLPRSGCSREPFLTPHTEPRPPSEARLRRKHWGLIHVTFGSISLLRNSDAIGDKGMVSWWLAGQEVLPECPSLPPSERKDLVTAHPWSWRPFPANLSCTLKFWINLIAP